jgi:hypothetical protein
MQPDYLEFVDARSHVGHFGCVCLLRRVDLSAIFWLLFKWKIQRAVIIMNDEFTNRQTEKNTYFLFELLGGDLLLIDFCANHQALLVAIHLFRATLQQITTRRSISKTNQIIIKRHQYVYTSLSVFCASFRRVA